MNSHFIIVNSESMKIQLVQVSELLAQLQKLVERTMELQVGGKEVS
jgi:hypothetical protein